MQKPSGPHSRFAFRDNYLAAIGTAVLMLISFFANAQNFQYPNPGLFGTKEHRRAVDSALYFPTGCGIPTDSTWLFSQGFVAKGEKVKQAALYYDSCGHLMYLWDPALKLWLVAGGGTDSAIANQYGLRINKVGTTRYLMVDTALQATNNRLLQVADSLRNMFVWNLFGDVKYVQYNIFANRPTYADNVGTLFLAANNGGIYLAKDTGWVTIAGPGGSSGVASFNTRTGAVTLSQLDVLTALGYAPLAPGDTTYLHNLVASKVTNYAGVSFWGVGTYASRPTSGTGLYFAYDSARTGGLFYINGATVTNLTPISNIYAKKDGGRGINIGRMADSSIYFKGLIDSIDAHVKLNGDSTVTIYVQAHDTTSANALATKYDVDTMRARIGPGGGGGSITFPQTLSNGRTLANNDSILLSNKELHIAGGPLRVDNLRMSYTNATMATGVLRLGGNTVTDTGHVMLNFYSPIEPGMNIFMGLDAGSRNIPLTNTGDNGALNIGIGAFNFQNITTAHENTGVGNYVFQLCTTCLGNAAFGETALKSVTTGYDNTAVGVHAFNLLTTGYQNTGVGKRTMEFMTSGFNNTSLGWQALHNITTANSNTGVGYGALAALTTAPDNTASGKGSAESLTTGGYNTAVGTHSLGYATDGNKNVAVGEEAGSTTTDLHDVGMTYVGFSARRDPAAAAGSFNTSSAIGYNAIVGQSHSMIFGAESTTADSVNYGFGTKTPDRSALAEFKSTSQGVLFPRMTTSNRDAMAATKATGLWIYNTDSVKYEYWNGSAWVDVTAGIAGTTYTFSNGLSLSGTTVSNTFFTGASGGQTLYGGTASGDKLTIKSTSNATLGSVDVFGKSDYALKITDNAFFTARIGGKSSGNMYFDANGNMSFGTMTTDGGTHQPIVDLLATGGTAVFTSANLGTGIRVTDRAGNGSLRLGIPANLQSVLSTGSNSDFLWGWQSSDGGTVTENFKMAKTTGNIVVGGGSDVATSIFSVGNTTSKGSIPAPVMTQSQFAAIASKANGLHAILSDSAYRLAKWDGSKVVCYTTSDLVSGGTGFANPMTSVGDIIYGGTSGAATRLAGNTTTTRQFYTSTGTGSAAQAPTIGVLQSGDIPNNAANTSGTAANLSGTPALPNGTTATTQTTGTSDNTLATTNFTQFAITNANALKSALLSTSTVANTTSEYGFGGGGNTGSASFFGGPGIPIGLTGAAAYRVTIQGVYSTVAVTAGNLTIKFKIGSNSFSGTITNLPAGVSNLSFSFNAIITVRSVSSGTATAVTDGVFEYTSAMLSGRSVLDLNNNGSTFTFPTASANNIDLSAQWATASASNTITANTFIVEKLF